MMKLHKFEDNNPLNNQNKEIFKEPFILNFSKYAQMVRRNLILVSIVSLIYVIYDIQVESGSIFVFNFKDLSDAVVLKILFLVCVYHFIHFGWICYDRWQEWSIKLTGTNRLTFPTLVGNSEFNIEEFKKIKKQSNLYSKLFDSGQLEKLQNNFDEVKGLLKKLKEYQECNDQNKKLKIEKKDIENLNLCLRYIAYELHCFNQRYKLMLRSQGWRWIILEIGLPLGIGLLALIKLLYKIWV